MSGISQLACQGRADETISADQQDSHRNVYGSLSISHIVAVGRQPFPYRIMEGLLVIRPNGPFVGRDRAEHQAVSSTSVIAPTPTGRRIRRFRWNYGQDNLRVMLCVQVDCVAGDLRAAVVVERFSRVWVDVEAGKVAA